MASGQRDQRIGLGQRGGDRLLDQHIGAGVQERPHDGRMGHGGRADADDIDGAQKIAPVGDGAHAMRRRDGLRVSPFGSATPISSTPGMCEYFEAWWPAESADPDHAGSQYARGCLYTLEQGIPGYYRPLRATVAGVGGDS